MPRNIKSGFAIYWTHSNLSENNETRCVGPIYNSKEAASQALLDLLNNEKVEIRLDDQYFIVPTYYIE